MLIIKMKNIENLVVRNNVHISGNCTCCSANVNEMLKAINLDGKYEIFELRVDQYLMVLNLCSISINKVLVTKTMTLKVLRNTNIRWKKYQHQ